MSNLNVKAQNRNLLNKKITKFYNGLIENLNYIICSRIKPINEKEFLNFSEIEDFVKKYYSNNKHKKNFDLEIENIKTSVGNLTTALSKSEEDKIDDIFDCLINKYSDSFQTDFSKKIVELSRKNENQIGNFKQALYNNLISKIEDDFRAKGLPEFYKLNIKVFKIESKKQA